MKPHTARRPEGRQSHDHHVRRDPHRAGLPLTGVGWRVLDTTDLLEKLPLPANRRFNQALATMHAVTDSVIDGHDNVADDLLTALPRLDPNPTSPAETEPACRTTAA